MKKVESNSLIQMQGYSVLASMLAKTLVSIPNLSAVRVKNAIAEFASHLPELNSTVKPSMEKQFFMYCYKLYQKDKKEPEEEAVESASQSDLKKEVDEIKRDIELLNTKIAGTWNSEDFDKDTINALELELMHMEEDLEKAEKKLKQNSKMVKSSTAPLWFRNMSKEEQEAYLKKHPGSKLKPGSNQRKDDTEPDEPDYGEDTEPDEPNYEEDDDRLAELEEKLEDISDDMLAVENKLRAEQDSDNPDPDKLDALNDELEDLELHYSETKEKLKQLKKV